MFSDGGNCDAICILFDNKHKLLIFLDPESIQTAYGTEVLARMNADTHDFFKLEVPNPDGNKRHISQPEYMRRNTHLR